MPDLRTAIRWLLEHNLAPDAEVWILSDATAEPVVSVGQRGPDFVLASAPWWSEPVPVPFRWLPFRDRLLESYSGGGTFRWGNRPETFRGSYSEYPDQAVFLLFLPYDTVIVESHTEIMERRKAQAKQLTQEIQSAWDS